MIESTKVFSAEPVSIRPPRNFHPCDAALFRERDSFVVPNASINVYSNIVAVGRGTMRYKGKFLNECFATKRCLRQFLQRRKHWQMYAEGLISRTIKFEKPSAWICDNWSTAYYHWFCDALPRLQGLSRQQRLDELTLFLPARAARFPYIRDSLRAFSLGDVRTLGRLQRVRCRKLFVPEHPAYTGFFRPELMSEIRDRLRAMVGSTKQTAGKTRISESYPSSPTGNNKRIFLSRADASRRRLTNEASLNAVLRNHGFETVVANDLTWFEQLELFHDVSHLVSIHGAGLTNMLMMPAGSRVLEIRDSSESTPDCYLTLASACGHDYYYAPSQRVDSSASIHEGDVTISPAALDQAIDQMVCEPDVSVHYSRLKPTSSNSLF